MIPIPVAAFRELFNRRDNMRYRYMTFFGKDAGVMRDGVLQPLVPPTKGRGPRATEDLRVAVWERDRPNGSIRESPYPIRSNGIIPALLYHRAKQKSGDIDHDAFLCFRYNVLTQAFEEYDGIYFTKNVAGQKSKKDSPIVKALYLHGGAARDMEYRDAEGRNKWK